MVNKMMKINNICCIGAGFVGGPTMAVIAEKCPDIKITVVDSDPIKINKWNGDLESLPVYEPGLKEIIEKTRGNNLFFSNDIEKSIDESEMIFIAVNTPTKKKGEGAGMAADLTNIEICAKEIAKYSRSDKIVIEKSTLPVRTAEKLKEILNSVNNGVKYTILSNPEFLAEGTAIKDLYKSDRVLIGGDDDDFGKAAVKALVEIYLRWIPKEKILTTNIWSSELAKLASNAMLAQRISSINSLSALCEKTGANIDELSTAIGMDNRIGPKFLKTSLGYGGSCFKKDILNLVYLCKFYGLNEVAEFWHQVVKINDYQINRFAKNVISYFNEDLIKKEILILGWAFKANTNDDRESASIYFTEKVYSYGANIEIYDPKVSEGKIFESINNYWKIEIDSLDLKKRVKVIRNLKKIDKKYDAIVISTDWEDFKTLDLSYHLKNKVVFDGRNILKDKRVKYIGK